MDVVTIKTKNELEELLFREPARAWYYTQQEADELIERLNSEVPQKAVTCYSIKTTLLNKFYGLGGEFEYLDGHFILAFAGADKDQIRPDIRPVYLHELIISDLHDVLWRSCVPKDKFLTDVIKWPVRLCYSLDFFNTLKDEKQKKMYKHLFFSEGSITSIKLNKYDSSLKLGANFRRALFDCVLVKNQKSYVLTDVPGEVLFLVRPLTITFEDALEEYRTSQFAYKK